MLRASRGLSRLRTREHEQRARESCESARLAVDVRDEVLPLLRVLLSAGPERVDGADDRVGCINSVLGLGGGSRT
jgi:hypothetical protein